MKPDELKSAIQLKGAELEAKMQAGKPHAELMQLYRELKELQYRLVQVKLEQENAAAQS